MNSLWILISWRTFMTNEKLLSFLSENSSVNNCLKHVYRSIHASLVQYYENPSNYSNSRLLLD